MERNYRILTTITILIANMTFFSCSNYAQSYQFDNGNWLINNKFKSKTVFTINGVFTFIKPEKVDSIINLKNKYCIPPFGDAHTHNLDGTYGLEKMIQNYLNDGIFYVQVLGNYGSGAERAREILAKKKLDVTYANGLLTATYGHGFYPYEPMAMGFYSPVEQFKNVDRVKKSRIAENDAYYFFDNISDVDNKWKLVLKYKPDNIKICLLDAADYVAKRSAEKVETYGLSEEVAAYIVKKAHSNGMRVFAHIETADDARICAKIGVDVLAHIPGYGWNGLPETKNKFCFTDSDAKLFKKSGLAIITTINLDYSTTYDSLGIATKHQDRFQSILEYKKFAIERLIKNKIPIGIGSDYYGKTAKLEIDYLMSIVATSNSKLLDIYCRQTPQIIFPNRKIGLIKENYEASFLVLNENPFNNLESINNISLKVKQGLILKN